MAWRMSRLVNKQTVAWPIARSRYDMIFGTPPHRRGYLASGTGRELESRSSLMQALLWETDMAVQPYLVLDN
jgi:hypothetical protein